MGVVHVYACAKRYLCGMRTYLLFNGPPSIPKVLNQTFAKMTTDKIGQLDGNGANHEHQWLQQLFRLGCTKGNPKRQRGTRHIPCTREIRFKQQILARRSLHFTSPICQFGSFGCYKHVWPCLTHLFWTSHYILDSTRRYASVHVQLVFCRQRPTAQKGPKKDIYRLPDAIPWFKHVWPKTKAQQHGSALPFLTK